jgi:ribulose-5-phosphate 4-epimerase/fuculose-1-phosphate aldolase
VELDIFNLEEIGPSNCIELDFHGSGISATPSKHPENPIYIENSGQHPDVTAIVHMHPLHATVLGALLSELRPLTCESPFLFLLNHGIVMVGASRRAV